VKKALEYLGSECRILRSHRDFKNIKKVILPGVGAFKAAIEKLKSKELFLSVKDWLLSNKSFLGICLGMQIIFEESEESQGVKGLCIFRGKALRFKKYKVPQIGWNQLHKIRESKLLDGIKDDAFFYFLHGYYVQPQDNDITVGTSDYGLVYTSVIEQGNIYAVQFHPEKSGDNGLKLLKNWIEKC
jgi:imidazole glycerol phosphate synthase glutamine amidotransferase subunit